MFEIRKAGPDENVKLLAAIETQFLDLKSKRIAPSKLQTHFVAFTNADGGDLFVGIEDPSVAGERIQGFASPEEANGHVHTLCFETKPPVDGCDAEFIDFGASGFVLHFTIPKSEKLHTTADGSYYERVNASSRPVRTERVTQLMYSRGAASFERTPAMNAELQDVSDSPHLLRYLERIGWPAN